VSVPVNGTVVWINLHPDLETIDDMGLKSLPKHSAEYLLEVIMRRYEKPPHHHDQQPPDRRMGQTAGRCPRH